MGNKKGVKEYAFSGQKTIFSAHFGSDCDYIGSNAFDGCSSLIEINDDNCITEIGANAFSKTGISHATFKKLTNISESAFEDCVNLESIDIPECTNIEKNAFIRTGISHATFKNLTEIGELAFQDCKKLESIDIPICSKIGANAFNGCENISQISLLNCDTILDGGFFDCKNLKKVYVYSDYCELGENVFFKKGEDNNTSIIDGIVFYFKPNMYDKYFNNTTWEPYKNHMVTMADEKNIIYKSTTGNKIDISNEHIKNTYIDGICGILTFEEPITSLGKIFSDTESDSDTNLQELLADIDFPPTCTKIEEYAFEGCSNLTNIILPDDLQTIGEYAFSGCSKFTTITIPQYVNKLGEGIFNGCSNLKTFYGKFATYGGKAIVYNNTLICVSPNDDSETGGRIYDISKIDRNITRLGNSCFSGCVELRRVNIPKSVQEIGANIFDGCGNLQEVHFYGKIPKIESLGINKSVKIFVPETDIDEYLNSSSFEQYKNNIYPRPDNGLLYFVTEIPNDVKTRTYTVDGETKTYCTISNMGTEIHNKYFQNNSSITSVILSDNISKIGSFAFDGCENLMYIYIPDSIISIGNQCFRNCKNLEKIHMPYGTLSTKATFGSKIFEGCSGLQKFETYYKDYVSDDGRCYIQNGILKFFAESNLTTEYEILSDVNIHTIGKSAFEGTNISSIKLNDYIKTIEPYAFYGCKDLSKILNWDNVITISENAFNGCESLGSSDNYSDPNSVPDPIPLPKYLKKIDNFAFSNCSNLNVSRIPINVSYIGDYAFAGTSCEEIDLSDTKIHQINQCAFKNCTHLVNIKLSKNTRTIKESAFEGCKKLTTVDQDKLSQIVNYNLETIGDSAFKDCEALSDIPYYGVSYIGDYAFAGCYIKSNKEISLNNIEHIGVGCFRGSGITKLEINNNKLTQISKNAFYNCSNLTSIEIPDTIKSIGDSAFCNCGKLGYGYTKDENEEEILNKIKLPTQLKELGERCFSFDDEYKDEKKEKTIVIQNGMETIPIFTKNEINESSSSLPFYKIKVRIEIPDNKLIYFLSNEYWNSYYKNIYTYPSNQ